MIAEFAKKLKPESTAYIFCDGQSYPIIYKSMFPHFKHVRPLIWDKIVSFNGYTWRHQHEIIAWGEGFESERIPTGEGDVIPVRQVLQKDRNHPAEKPVKLLSQLIKKHPHYNLVFDPYAGSGSVAVACKMEGKNHISIEIDPGFHKIATQRMNGASKNQNQEKLL